MSSTAEVVLLMDSYMMTCLVDVSFSGEHPFVMKNRACQRKNILKCSPHSLQSGTYLHIHTHIYMILYNVLVCVQYIDI